MVDPVTLSMKTSVSLASLALAPASSVKLLLLPAAVDRREEETDRELSFMAKTGAHCTGLVVAGTTCQWKRSAVSRKLGEFPVQSDWILTVKLGSNAAWRLANAASPEGWAPSVMTPAGLARSWAHVAARGRWATAPVDEEPGVMRTRYGPTIIRAGILSKLVPWRVTFIGPVALCLMDSNVGCVLCRTGVADALTLGRLRVKLDHRRPFPMLHCNSTVPEAPKGGVMSMDKATANVVLAARGVVSDTSWVAAKLEGVDARERTAVSAEHVTLKGVASVAILLTVTVRVAVLTWP